MKEYIERTGYERALTAEIRNGLIAIDFRRLVKPSFLTFWPNKEVWEKSWAYIEYLNKGFYKGIQGYYEFYWKIENSGKELRISALVCKDYELAQALFLLESNGSTNGFRIPWDRCDKQIGTFCVTDSDSEYRAFLYKNVVVTLNNAPNKQISEQTAQWLFDVLKGFPLIPMNAPLQFRREPYATPVFEYLGSEAPAAGDSSRMGADGGDDDN
jgi:hypothetical protein